MQIEAGLGCILLYAEFSEIAIDSPSYPNNDNRINLFSSQHICLYSISLLHGEYPGDASTQTMPSLDY